MSGGRLLFNRALSVSLFIRDLCFLELRSCVWQCMIVNLLGECRMIGTMTRHSEFGEREECWQVYFPNLYT